MDCVFTNLQIFFISKQKYSITLYFIHSCNSFKKFGLFCNFVLNLSHQLSNALMGTFPDASMKLAK
ncbi:Uncharacterised protein [Chlamydia trachomatis]|nr:Uncharacterised protein [Chlamydia trachomatis]